MLLRYSGCFLLVFYAFCIAGALGLMCQHGVKGLMTRVTIFICDIVVSENMIWSARSLIDIC